MHKFQQWTYNFSSWIKESMADIFYTSAKVTPPTKVDLVKLHFLICQHKALPSPCCSLKALVDTYAKRSEGFSLLSAGWDNKPGITWQRLQRDDQIDMGNASTTESDKETLLDLSSSKQPKESNSKGLVMKDCHFVRVMHFMSFSRIDWKITHSWPLGTYHFL